MLNVLNTRLDGRRALVTGASSGIGRATAQGLAGLGCDLAVVARRAERLEALRRELAPTGVQVDTLAVDLSTPDAIARMDTAGFFDVDILINNAGGALGKDAVATADVAEWRAMIDVNVTAAFLVTRAVVPRMLARGGGDIVAISSIAGHIPYEGGSVYCATKHALRAFCTALRRETAGQDLRVVQVSPGMVDTEFSAVRFRGDQTAADAVYAGMTPLSAEDVARQILWALLQPRHVNLDEVMVMASAQGGVGKVVRRQ
ncbi:MAG: SDR family NAD(P)-dependent oxidoreductase [Alphaproteobacteria bacterium]|nr:SDR family NAD(P)-dependent oxidoreductase [Alphaproteobacteria bacterium]